MLERVLEPEVMDTPEEARDYDSMDHREVNAKFVTDFLDIWSGGSCNLLDVGTGTAQIPIELARRFPEAQITAIDLSHHMLDLARRNIGSAELIERIVVQVVDAKGLPFLAESFDGVISNSILHHIPKPLDCMLEMTRVCRSGGLIFVRDLCRPDDDAKVQWLVDMYAKDANPHQRQLFDQSLRAALTLDEIRALAEELGFDPLDVQMTSDRHWTWASWKAKRDVE